MRLYIYRELVKCDKIAEKVNSNFKKLSEIYVKVYKCSDFTLISILDSSY